MWSDSLYFFADPPSVNHDRTIADAFCRTIGLAYLRGTILLNNYCRKPGPGFGTTVINNSFIDFLLT